MGKKNRDGEKMFNAMMAGGKRMALFHDVETSAAGMRQHLGKLDAALREAANGANEKTLAHIDKLIGSCLILNDTLKVFQGYAIDAQNDGILVLNEKGEEI